MSVRRNFTQLLAASVAVLAFSLTFMAAPAAADEVSAAGYTNGCFNCNPPPVPNTSATQTASLFGLTYVNSIFSGTSASGFFGVGGNPIAPPTQNIDNLGSFTLANSLATYTGNTFSLRVTFTVPTGINGGGSSVFSATLTGSVTSTGNGGVFLDFNNTPQLFTFSFQNQNGTTTTGSFSLTVDDLSVNPGQTSSLSGQITGASQSSAPVAVTLTSFAARRTQQGVELRWRTASSIDTLGFNVYGDMNGKRVRLNRKLIAAKRAGAALYSFAYQVRQGKAAPSRFWLQVVNLDGSRSWYGPAGVVARG